MTESNKKDTFEILFKVNTILLISCLALGFSEFLYLIPSSISYNLDYTEILNLFCFTITFYFIFYLLTGIFANSIILFSSYIKKKQRYYFAISTFLLTLLNLLPVYLTFLNFLTGLINSIEVIAFLSASTSLLISLFISNFIVNSYKNFINTAERHCTKIVIFFIITIFSSFYIVDKMSFSHNVLITYYLFLLFSFYLITVFTLTTKFKSLLSGRKKYGYLLIICLAALAYTTFAFSNDNKLEAFIKKHTFFENNLIDITSSLLDFDKDDFGPNLLVGEGDINNSKPELNPLAKDRPENYIDENGFNRDLNKIYYNIIEKNNINPQILDNYNVLLITVNNINADDIEKDSYIDQLIKDGVYFPNAYSLSKDRTLNLNGILNSNLLNIKGLKRIKPVIPQGDDILAFLKVANYANFIFFDIPYSSSIDAFKIIKDTNFFHANTYTLEYPINSTSFLNEMDIYYKKPFFCWLYLDKRIPQDLNVRFQNFFDSITDLNKNKNTLFVVVFIPSLLQDSNNDPARCPILFYYDGIKARTINAKVSITDILPTILTLLGKSYPVKSYIGRDLSTYIFDKESKERPIFTFAPEKFKAAIYYKQFKLIYSIKEHYIEIYDTVKDPEKKNNLVNHKNPHFKLMKSWMDYYLSNGSK